MSANSSSGNTRLGAAVLAALMVAIAFTVFVLPRVTFGKRISVGVTFAHASGLREGAMVVVAGRKVGTIKSIELVRGPHHMAPTGEQKALVRISIRSAIADKLAKSDDFFVSSHGPLSERYLEIAITEREPKRVALADGDIVTGVDPPSLDRVMTRTWTNLEVARRFANELSQPFADLRQQLRTLQATLQNDATLWPLAGELVVNVAKFREQLDSTAAALASLQKFPPEALLHQASGVAAQVNTATASLSAKLSVLQASVDSNLAGPTAALLNKVSSVIAQSKAALAQVDTVRANFSALVTVLARGEGSLPRILTDPEFPEDAKELGKVLKRTPWKIIGHPEDKR